TPTSPSAAVVRTTASVPTSRNSKSRSCSTSCSVAPMTSAPWPRSPGSSSRSAIPFCWQRRSYGSACHDPRGSAAELVLEHRREFSGDGDIELGVGARLRLAVGAPADETRDPPEASGLQLVELDLDHPLDA